MGPAGPGAQAGSSDWGPSHCRTSAAEPRIGPSLTLWSAVAQACPTRADGAAGSGGAASLGARVPETYRYRWTAQGQRARRAVATNDEPCSCDIALLQRLAVAGPPTQCLHSLHSPSNRHCSGASRDAMSSRPKLSRAAIDLIGVPGRLPCATLRRTPPDGQRPSPALETGLRPHTSQVPTTGGNDLDATPESRRPGQPAIPGDQNGRQGFGQCHIRRVVRRQAVTELPAPGKQLPMGGPLNRNLPEVVQGQACPALTQAAATYWVRHRLHE